MKDLQTHIKAAAKGGFFLWRLNFLLSLGIPFNRPHRIKIVRITQDEAMAKIPFRRRNQNHIRGIHACGLATVAEFTSGLYLLGRVDPSKYRLIMQSMKMEYHYQAKTDVIASYGMSPAEWTSIEVQLEGADSLVHTCEVNLEDRSGNKVATANIQWQLKPWAKVKTSIK